MSASPLLAVLLLALTAAPCVPVTRGSGGTSAAHPAYPDAAAACGPSTDVEVGLEEYGGGRIVDITHAYRPDLPFPGRDGLGAVTRLTESMANGSINNVSELRMVVHTGTHVDAPGHMVQEHFEAGLGVDKLDLDVLNGPALLIDVPRDTNITAQAMESLNITKGIRRVLFRTLNTDRKLMWTKEIDPSFVGFTEDGAHWLVDNTDIKLVGIDYISVASFDHLIPAHLVFLNRRKARADGVLAGHLPEELKFQCSIYADDVIIFFNPSIQEARAIREILGIFARASGLLTNMTKSSITPIFGGLNVLTEIQAILGCKIQEFPIKYLGLPLSAKRIPKAHLRGLVDNVERKLPTAMGSLMARSGRLVWIKSVLSAVPVYAMLADGLPPWARTEIDSICRRFLWAGREASTRGKCMVAWQSVCRPVELGGLGIVDLKLAGIALQCRWLWQQRCDDQRAWFALPLSIDHETKAFFAASITIIIGNGQRTKFWTDAWSNGKAIAELAPTLTGLVRNRARKSTTVVQALNSRAWTRQITGGLTVQAIHELFMIWDEVEQVHLQPDVEDRAIWKWTNDGVYSSQSAYRALHLGSATMEGAEMLWETWAPLRTKIFLWLTLRRRQWTADRRRRHGLDARDECWLCDQEHESIDHILVHCSYTRQIWASVFTVLRKPLPETAIGASTLQHWLQLRTAWSGRQRKGFDSLHALITWTVWKERCSRCFRSEVASVQQLLRTVRTEACNWIQAGAQDLGCLFSE